MRRVPSFVGALVLSVIVAQPSSAGSPAGYSTGGVLPPEPGSRQDPAFVIAKEQGRVRVHPDGRVEILATAPAVSYQNSAVLATSWTGRVWEPQGSGTAYNQVIGTGKYYLQQEWSNKSTNCVLQGT